ncbi:MAG: wax ester/triacylglycerol synthase family O-acyltransferase [Pseudomonadales bacterium]
MQQLSGLDAAFIHQESASTPMHVSAVLVYSPHERSGKSLNSEALAKVLLSASRHIPFLTQKLKTLPMGIDEPYWARDNNFEVNDHITERRLPTPGNWQQLKQCFAELHCKRLDRTRPLWHAALVTGLDDCNDIPKGSIALVLKVHHACIDGVSLAAMVATMHKAEANSDVCVPAAIELDDYELWNRAGIKSWTRPFKFANTVSNLLPKMLQGSDDEAVCLGSDISHQQTILNARVSRKRVLGAVRLPWSEIVQLKRNVRRVTFNDIALAIVSGALRSYLTRHGKLPAKSLVAGAPMSLRNREDASHGNKLATLQVGLATDLEDPVERLRAIHQYAVRGKKKLNAMGSGTIMDISDSMAPAALAEGLRALSFASTRIADIPVPFHVMVSNVPGPSQPLDLQGWPLHSLMGFGPIRHTMGLFHIVTQTEYEQSISFVSCDSILPDAEFYEQCLQDSFLELCHASDNY